MDIENKPIGVEYDYTRGKGKIRYVAKADGPSFVESEIVVEHEFDITDEAVLEAHEFLAQQAVKEAGKAANNLEVDEDAA